MEILYPDLIQKIFNEILENQSFDDLVRWYDSLPSFQKPWVREMVKDKELHIFYKILKECVIQFVLETNWDFFDEYEQHYNFAPLGYDYDYQFIFLYDATKKFLNELNVDEINLLNDGKLYYDLYKKFTLEELEGLQQQYNNNIKILNPFDFYQIKKDKKLPDRIRSIAKNIEKEYNKRCDEYFTTIRQLVIERMNVDQFNEFYKFVQFHINDLRHDDESEEKLETYFYCIKRKIKYLYVKFKIDYLNLF